VPAAVPLILKPADIRRFGIEKNLCGAPRAQLPGISIRHSSLPMGESYRERLQR